MSTHAFTARRIILTAGTVLLPLSGSYAIPVLPDGEFFAPSSLVTSSGWSYTGTLPSSLNAGFVARNVDDPICAFGICVGGDTQDSSGNRSMTSAAGSSPSYSLAFRGGFNARTFEAWTTNLVSQSKGEKFDSDVDSVQFPEPGGSTVNEHPIPADWQGLHGYANPSGNYAKFDRTFTVSRTYLDPGEFNCPNVAPGGLPTGHCALTGAYLKAGADLQANLQGFGSIENTVAGTQSVTIDAKANRTTTFLVNGDPIFFGEINGSASTFNLEEEKVKAVDFSFSGSFKTQTITVGANVQWDGRDETSSFDASYVKRVEMPEYEKVVTANTYLVEVRDAPQLTAGIAGTDFYRASVLASAGISAIDAVFLPVFQPVASSRLVVKDASTFNLNSRDLPIPAGGFREDLPVFLHFLLANEGSVDLTVDHLDFSFVEDDLLFDDLLGSISQDMNFLIHPNSALQLSAFLRIPASALNSAIDFLEGANLELAGSGSFRFHDIYGTRERSFVLALPEPGNTFLLVIVLMLLVMMCEPKHRANSIIASTAGKKRVERAMRR